MQETKLKIDLSQGILEVEGSEQLVRDIYSDFKERLTTKPTTPMKEQTKINTANKSTLKKTVNKPKNQKTKSPSSNSGSLVKDLDLFASDDKPSLKDFYNKYVVKTNFERNLVFVYYLQELREFEGITIDHIFTCYKHINGIKVPGHLRQSIFDTASKKGWLDSSNMNNIIVSISGTNHLEHDLPKNDIHNG